MNAQDANKKQLEIWRKTIEYEIRMMAPQSVPACEAFLDRLERFEQQLEADENHATAVMMGSSSST